MSLKEVLRKRLLFDMIKSVVPNQWKLVVVDAKSLQILNSVCEIYDILDENVTLVESIERKRQPYTNLEAIYFISPTAESIDRLIADFQQRPLYAAANVFFTAALPDKLFQKLKRNNVSKHIKNLKELFVDFLAFESRVFNFDIPQSFNTFYNPSKTGEITHEVENVARKLVSVLATLGEYPIIRYYDPNGDRRTIAARVAFQLENELENLCNMDPSFPPKSNYERTTLIVVDRTIDTSGPLVHEFTYQAMVNDLIGLENGIKYIQNGAAGEKAVILDEKDNLWNKYRHTHIAEVSSEVSKQFNQFINENKAASSVAKGRQGGASLKELKDTIQALPQYQEMKDKFSVHIDLCQRCNNIFSKNNLTDIAKIEQNLITGVTAEGNIPKNIIMDMVPLLDSHSVDIYDKLRLLILYIICYDGVPQEDLRKLVEHAHMANPELDIISNFKYLGINLKSNQLKDLKPKRGYDSMWEKEKVKRKLNKNDEEESYELSRYVSTLKYVIEDNIHNILNTTIFPATKEPATHKKPEVETNLKGTSLRSTKPSWAKKSADRDKQKDSGSPALSEKEDLRKRGPRTIIFVVGGLDYSEMRSVYELCNEYSRDVIIGSTHIITPVSYMKSIQQLKVGNNLLASSSTSSSLNNYGSGYLERKPRNASLNSIHHESPRMSPRNSPPMRGSTSSSLRNSPPMRASPSMRSGSSPNFGSPNMRGSRSPQQRPSPPQQRRMQANSPPSRPMEPIGSGGHSRSFHSSHSNGELYPQQQTPPQRAPPSQQLKRVDKPDKKKKFGLFKK
ncbi:Sec1-like protein [Neocallimastix lanati (nom. inval.)]|jgi:syntaxin-binding protein 1|uniref:Sec1-like protein n=1 Tax=Neocallimastix californiae TaxID=1754190 RepID=A0A1Y2CVX7_9FUNG|nr:Sec1-like protein [Neocallimastix sp. JGI-2020a]ORY51182.1 Sec1-like protein [Neocallimastix californiae]|eukprot:ORY51182.1 Sec1-like protein [Neocallimastix californiae]